MEIQIPVLNEKFHYGLSLQEMSLSSPPSTPTTPNSSFTIKALDLKDTEDALVFLRKFFFRDEPLNIEKKLLENEGDTCVELEEFSTKSILENVSLKAVSCDTDEIIGLCLNGVLKRDEVEKEFHCENKKFAEILGLLDFVDQEADVFGKYPDVDKILSVKILSVDGAQRGKGIAKALMDKSRDLCKQQNIPLMRVDCTSHFSAKAVSRLGFECIYTLNYSDYKKNGVAVFKPDPPHEQVKVYTQRVL